MTANTTGTNTALINTLEQNTTGSHNTSMGDGVKNANTTAIATLLVGRQAMVSNTTGTRNVGIGGALEDNTTGNYNVGVGYVVLNNSNGSYNTGIGYEALKQNTTGQQNQAMVLMEQLQIQQVITTWRLVVMLMAKARRQTIIVEWVEMHNFLHNKKSYYLLTMEVLALYFLLQQELITLLWY